jgi:hypothetical protein
MFVDAGKTGFPKPINYPSSYAFPKTALYFKDNCEAIEITGETLLTLDAFEDSHLLMVEMVENKL